MPDETTSAPQADAANAQTTQTDGVTPPQNQGQAPMSVEDAKGLLAKLKTSEAPSRDPLLEHSAPDPLFDGGEKEDPPGTLPEEEAAAPAEETAESEEQPTEETPEGEAEAPTEETEGEAAPEPEAEQDDKGRKRLHINRKDKETGEYVLPARDRAILQLMAEEAIPLAEAERRLFGDRQPAQPAEQQAQPEAKPAPKTVQQIEQEIVALRAQRREAAAQLDNEKQADLSERIEDLIAEKQDARLREERGQQEQQSQQTAFQSAVKDSMAQAKTLYPDAGKQGTPLWNAMAAELGKMGDRHPLFQDPEWPEAVAAKVAARLGIAPAAKATAAPAKTASVTKAAPAAPVKRGTPLLAPGSVSAQKPPTDPAKELSAKIAEARGNNDVKALQALMSQAVKLQPQRKLDPAATV